MKKSSLYKSYLAYSIQFGVNGSSRTFMKMEVFRVSNLRLCSGTVVDSHEQTFIWEDNWHPFGFGLRTKQV
ncbi:hypothetical protein CDL12_03062 [Handroanthus impetiginosus]|uniref:Uncharacterized protein n=1 Tax=Handroanthus impetiginosus TaxID=429701 RepID=A0A2G9I3A4_9LAMI|nr:hypothetical protein CDL12_03062 [Handroanthus impetiginosus]